MALRAGILTSLTSLFIATSPGIGHAAQVNWLSVDFFVPPAGVKPPRGVRILAEEPDASACRERIREAVCLADGPPADPTKGESPHSRPCRRDVDKTYFTEPLVGLVDRLPPPLRRVFCTVDEIRIENSFTGSAYAGFSEPDAHGQTHPLLGFRRSIYEQRVGLSPWSTWKEQLSFGGPLEAFGMNPVLQRVEANTADPNFQDLLFFLVSHEMGHLLDFTHGLNNYDCVGEAHEDLSNCTFRAGSWGALSWRTPGEVLPQDDFTNRSKLCFYDCPSGTVPPDQMHATYEGFLKSSFASLYGSQQPWDDFAESVAFASLQLEGKVPYRVILPDGMTVDAIARTRDDPAVAAKRRYVLKVLEAP
jgi:hypothetical protein